MLWCLVQVVDAAISESVFNMLEGCVPEFTEQGYDRPPSGSTISGTSQIMQVATQNEMEDAAAEEANIIGQTHQKRHAISVGIASMAAQARDRGAQPKSSGAHRSIRPPCTHHTVHAGVVPSATFQTRDGRYVIIGGNGDSVYSRLMTAVGRPDMTASNPLYQSNTNRCKHEKEIYAVGHLRACMMLTL